VFVSAIGYKQRYIIRYLFFILSGDADRCHVHFFSSSLTSSSNLTYTWPSECHQDAIMLFMPLTNHRHPAYAFPCSYVVPPLTSADDFEILAKSSLRLVFGIQTSLSARVPSAVHAAANGALKRASRAHKKGDKSGSAELRFHRSARRYRS